MRLEEIEKCIMDLPKDQLVEFRTWYEKFDSDNWDKQIAQDAAAGNLDAIAEVALQEYKAGRATKL